MAGRGIAHQKIPYFGFRNHSYDNGGPCPEFAAELPARLPMPTAAKLSAGLPMHIDRSQRGSQSGA
jgi:hypothetical protein